MKFRLSCLHQRHGLHDLLRFHFREGVLVSPSASNRIKASETLDTVLGSLPLFGTMHGEVFETYKAQEGHACYESSSRHKKSR